MRILPAHVSRLLLLCSGVDGLRRLGVGLQLRLVVVRQLLGQEEEERRHPPPHSRVPWPLGAGSAPWDWLLAETGGSRSSGHTATHAIIQLSTCIDTYMLIKNLIYIISQAFMMSKANSTLANFPGPCSI